MVLQHDDGFELSLITLLHKFWFAHNLLCFGRIEVRILEESNTEYIQQQATGRELETLTGALLTKLLAPHLISLHYRTNCIVATKLVDTSLQNLKVTLSLIELLHSPGLTATRTVQYLHILGDAPVSTGHAFELRLITKLLLDEPLAVAATHILARRILIPQDTIDRHDS